MGDFVRLLEANNLLAILNAAGGIFTAYYNLQFYFLYRGSGHPREKYLWAKLAWAVIGMYVAGLYIYVLLVNVNLLSAYDSVTFGRLFVRPLFTVIIWVAMSEAIMNWRRP